MEKLINGVRSIQEMLNTQKFETEQATKQGLIMPLIAALGYNVWNVAEVTPEAVADVGAKKGEKVDFKISVNGQSVMIIECKTRAEVCLDSHIDQLFRYFTTSDVNLAVLTNGDDYWFFIDSQKQNVMDLRPYHTFKISELKTDDDIVGHLSKFCKEFIVN